MKQFITYALAGLASISLIASCTNTRPVAPTSQEMVEYLASDSLEGRFPGTKGGQLAAQYIADNFRNAGLTPLGDDDYMLPFLAHTFKQDYKTQNVAGFVAGSDENLKREVVIIGAHYDHLGMGGPTTSSRMPDSIAVHNGADDNASGVSAVMRLAYRFAQQPTKRSLLFVTFGAEELGLHGSKALASQLKELHLAADSSYYMAMINADMIGHLRKGWFSVDGTGTAPASHALVDTLAAHNQLKVSQVASGYGSSDHTAFYLKKIPVFFVHTQATDDYHTPLDDAYKLNYQGMDSVIDFMGDLVAELGNRSERLKFQTTEDVSKGGKSRYKLKVKLGLMPDMTGSCEEGMSADIVTKGKPAYRAGMRSGDIIVAMNNRPIKDVYDYMKCLRTFNPGEIIMVKVLRDGQEMMFSVKP